MDANVLRKLPTILGVASCFVFFGCVSVEDTASSGSFLVEKGMALEELVAGLGGPDQVLPHPDGVEGVELWVYLSERANTKMVSTDMKEVPFVDPVTGYQGVVLENVMSPEVTYSQTKTIFLVANGKVEAWKVQNKDKNAL